MSTLLVKNISTLVTNDEALGDFKDGAIYVENNEIRQVGCMVFFISIKIRGN